MSVCLRRWSAGYFCDQQHGAGAGGSTGRDESHGTTQVRIVFNGSPERCSATIHAGRFRVGRNVLADVPVRLERTMLR